MFAKRSVGLDLREHHCIMVALRMKRKRPVIDYLKWGSVAEDWVTTDQIDEQFQLHEHIKKMINPKIRSKLKRKQTHMSIPTQHIIVRRITSLPDLPIKELAQLIPFEMSENVPLPFEDPVYDFVKVGTLSAGIEEPMQDDQAAASLDLLGEAMVAEEQDLGPKSDLLLIASSHQLAATLGEGIRKAGLKPVSAEIRALSLQRVIHFMQPDWLQDVEIVVDIAEHSSDIHIFRDGHLSFTRNVNSMHRSMIEDEFDEELFAEDLSGELERAIHFFRYSMNERERAIKRVIIVGEFQDTLLDRLSQQTSLLIMKPDYKAFQQGGRYHTSELLSQAAVSIGLALRGLND